MGLFFSIQSMADVQVGGTYRPYLHCESSRGGVSVAISQNVDLKDTFAPYRVSVEKKAGSKEVKLENIVARSVPIRHKDVQAVLEGNFEKAGYRFQIFLMRQWKDRGQVAYLFDNLSARNTIYCQRIITGF